MAQGRTAGSERCSGLPIPRRAERSTRWGPGRTCRPGGGSFRVAARVVSVGFDDSSHPELLPGSYVAVEMEDSGEGMDETTLRKAFDPFFTTRTRPARAGLGLSTVYGLVTQAGGKIDLESAPGEGTKVAIYLPVHERSTEEAS